jgi:hypothetical protein
MKQVALIGILFLLGSIFVPAVVFAQYAGCPNDCAPGPCLCDNNPNPEFYLGNACGNCGVERYDCDGCNWYAPYCWNQGQCAPGNTTCSGTRFQTCDAACFWQNSGTDGDADGTDLQCGDSLCDHEPAYVNATRLSSESQGCVGPGCALCEDEADNDCDLSYDCADSDCQSGTLSGTVYDQDDDILAGAAINIYNTFLSLNKTTNSNGAGAYSFSNLCGMYTATASKTTYLSDIQSFPVNPLSPQLKDFTLVYSQICEADCTYTGDTLIHSSCLGINGCSFYNANAAAACNNAQPGWFRDYNASHFVQCASSSPQEKIILPASVSCTKDNLIKVSKIVSFQGKLVKLTVATCG